MIDSLVTILVPTSPIPSHPSTDIIEETIASLRWHFPQAEIKILTDGLREEQIDAKERYSTYHLRLSHLYTKSYFFRFPDHRHQVGMLREYLPQVDTPYIFFCEHDTPLVKRPIDWDALHTELQSGIVELVRFLPDVEIHPEHMHLMGQEIHTSRLLLRETTQFSARPHIATKAFYERALDKFTPEAKCFVEDKMHSVCQTEPWENWKMAVYLDPEGKDSKFSYHLDGRASSRKYDELQIF